MKRFSVLLLVLLLIILPIFCVSCSDEAEEENPSVTEESGIISDEHVFLYTMQGITKYSYVDSRLDSIVVLDTVTLNPNRAAFDKYSCDYVYDESGNLSELKYMGNSFTVTERDENGRALKADGKTAFNNLSVEFSYGENGIMSEESFYEGDKLTLVNTFDASARPVKIEYKGIASVKYDYADSEIYVNVEFDDKTKTSPDIVLYFDSLGYPKYHVQSYESTINGVTWTYNEKSLCIDAVVDSVNDGYKYTEEYLIDYDDNDKIKQVTHFSPDANGEPVISGRYSYEYDGEVLVKQTETQLDNNVQTKFIEYEYKNGENIKSVTENYADGKMTDKEVIANEYNEYSLLYKTSVIKYNADSAYESGSYKTVEYNEKGYAKKIETAFYGENEALLHTFFEEYEYDSAGNRTKALYTVYDAEGEFKEKECDEFEYDSDGRITLQNVIIYSSQDEIFNRTETVNVYTLSGEIRTSTVTVYDGEGNVLNTETTTAD